MYLFYFDCGTSKTRGYLLKDGKVISSSKRDIGSKDVSINNDKNILIKSMKEIYDEVLLENLLIDINIQFIYASGMITSPYGLVEVQHELTPVDKRRMKESIHVHCENTLFHRNIYLISGLKTTSYNYTLDNIDQVNNVRGEEIEVFGICSSIPGNWKNSKTAIILPGSHTHTILIEGETILDIFSTFSGELFHAITTSTILSNSTCVDLDSEKMIDIKTVSIGCKNLKKYGFLRAIYIAHAMKIFDVGDNYLRRDLLSSVINASVVQSIGLNIKNKWRDVQHIVVYADEKMLSIYGEAIRHFIPELSEELLSIDRNNVNCSVEGLMSIINS